MPAEKQCELFYQLVGDVLEYGIRYVPIPRSETVSWVLWSYVINWVLTIRLVE